MTRDTRRPEKGSQPETSLDADFLAALWEDAPFARLPPDAPPELKDMVQTIENPKRVYAIHRASRRHNFQILVEIYILQLRYGCDSKACTTSTCFSCRKRLAGKAPIRRYNTTSARTLAVYLASQDNPETGLCPYLKPPKDAPAALGSLIFSPNPAVPAFNDPFSKRSVIPKDTRRRKSSSAAMPNGDDSKSQKATPDVKDTGRQPASSSKERSHFDSMTGAAKVPFKMAERPVSKDYRSFAANVFGTVAFKMLEWLTPAGLEAMSEKVAALEADAAQSPSKDDAQRSQKPSGQSTPMQPIPPIVYADKPSSDLPQPTTDQGPDAVLGQASQKLHGSNSTMSNSRPSKPKRSSSARVRANSKPTRKLSIEPYPASSLSEDVTSGLASPRASHEKPPRPSKTSHVNPYAIPEIPSTPSFFDNVPPQNHSVTIVQEPESQLKTSPRNVRSPAEAPHPQEATPEARCAQADQPTIVFKQSDEPVDVSITDNMLPQSLTYLNIEIVDLVCDILQDDGTSESHLFDPPIITSTYSGLKDQAPKMRRKHNPRNTYPKRLRRQWKLFIEQSLFNILSDPATLVSSFVKDDELLDSHTIWYCMLRLTRVAPSLVFHSLWMAAGSLFGAPNSLQSLRSPATKVFRRTDRPLANQEAGRLLSICLHALVAAAPLITDSRILFDMSRIRSNGLVLAGSGALARQPAWLCLLYDDAFSNDLALRLARRLFAAISARKCFADMAAQDDDVEDNDQELDALRPLISQLDLLNSYSSSNPELGQLQTAGHESRVSTLLLDWAKTVMLQEWDGQPEISCDGSFGGALSLIAAMYEKRQDLLLGDVQFRVDYFAERLDSINMPVAWLTHISSRQKKHLLDFPFIFDPSTLVSYFRSVNFSKMSRSYEESSSLQTRMKAIVAPGGLITNPHHKLVLQDLLKTASSKYLILDISRKNVIRDAFDQLWQREDRELHRPLKIHLGEDAGEEGFDSGGVQQEFFRLAVAECLNPDYGAFTVDDRTRMAWFVPGSVVPAWKFEILGLLVSLAVYNGLTLPITFPKALYRKLLGEPVNELHHIADGWPDLAMGLTTLLEWDERQGLVEDVFARTYEFSVSMFGQPISREMNDQARSWPQFEATGGKSPVDENPEDAPLVTNENRNAYVSDYIKYLTDISVRPQYEAFERGFRACLHPKALRLLTPPLLQSLVEGVQEIDISELRRYTRYVGWDASHRGVRDFWSIVKRYDEKMKRRLLEFVTASDRVPVGGMKNLQFVVQRNGEEEGEGGHLPTAYTCYGTLLLPEYKDKDVLRERLAMALENAQGFGFA
ncbi:Putative ubiquitin- ligase E3A zinc-binding protein [Colletotrichum destructivum]|uniref:HECT-type E3 ubiquitin transferase n=1 Tax=Colletotrichum destructivum TaxID=34406 RepID=A0AAX4IKE7_9PEZI|nr:Putative ubiquitin- ligase E3A zinc-binding protein [Colletotrichum destructivum]